MDTREEKIEQLIRLKAWLISRPMPQDMPSPEVQAQRAAAWKIEKAEIEAKIEILEDELGLQNSTISYSQGWTSPQLIPQGLPAPEDSEMSEGAVQTMSITSKIPWGWIAVLVIPYLIYKKKK